MIRNGSLYLKDGQSVNAEWYRNIVGANATATDDIFKKLRYGVNENVYCQRN